MIGGRNAGLLCPPLETECESDPEERDRDHGDGGEGKRDAADAAGCVLAGQDAEGEQDEEAERKREQ